MTREDLKNYKNNQRWINGRFQYIEEYKTSIMHITTVISDMPKGSRKIEDNIAEKVAELLDTINVLLKKIVQENRKQKIILEQLDKVEQPYKLILEKVYIQGKSLVTTASEMNYNYEYIKKIHGIALNKFDKGENK